MGKAQTKALVWPVILLACSTCAFALDPSLEINQYAHTAWKVSDGFSRGTINAIAQAADGYLWLGTEFGLLRFDGVRAVPWQPPEGEKLPDDRIRSLLVGHDGTLWIGTWKGLASWKNGRLTQYPELAGRALGPLLEDHEGTVWAGVYGIPDATICAIRSGRLQCSGEQGLGRGVYSLYEDGQHNLWAGGTGVWRWRPGPPKFYPMPKSANGVQDMIESDSGALLIAVGGGIRQLHDGKAEAYRLPGIGPQFKPTRLFRDRNGSLWIATTNRGSCIYTREGSTHLRGRTVSPAIPFGESLRIVKAISGSLRWMAWTAFAISPSPRSLSSWACRMAFFGPF